MGLVDYSFYSRVLQEQVNIDGLVHGLRKTTRMIFCENLIA
jgi:hypothetical protein